MITPSENVTVRFSRNNVYEFQNGSLELECLLLHTPLDVGDHFYFKYKDIEFSVNPLSPDFVGVFKREVAQ